MAVGAVAVAGGWAGASQPTSKAAAAEKSPQNKGTQEQGAKAASQTEKKPAAQPDEQTRRELQQLQSSLQELRSKAIDLQIQLQTASGEEAASVQDQLFQVQQDISTVEDSIRLRGGTVPGEGAKPKGGPDEAELRERALQALKGAGKQEAKAAQAQKEGMFTFGPFSEPVELTLLVDLVRQALDINLMIADTGLAGQQVVIRSPIEVPRERLLDFLTMLLEQKDFTLVRDSNSGVYVVTKVANAPTEVSANPFSTTQVIPTKGLRPSSLQSFVVGILRQTQQAASAPLFLDEIGVIVATGTPRQLQAIADLIDRIASSANEMTWTRYDLANVSASVARDRVLDLLGSTPTRTIGAGADQRNVPIVTSQTIVDLPQRLTADPQSNALFFRGRPDERIALERLLKIIDVPNTLVSRWYPVGLRTATKVVAAGERQGLGGVTYEETDQTTQQQGGRTPRVPVPNPNLQQNTSATGGSGFVVYPEEGGFMYSGTEEQHQRVEALVYSFSSLSEEDLVVYEFYKLKHSDSTDVAGIILDLISNVVPSGNRGLLGQDLSRRGNQRAQAARQPAQGAAEANKAAEGQTGDGIGEIQATEDINVIADEFNNQVVVKAPRRLQPQFARLIHKLDLKRPQVYLETMIVTVTHDDSSSFAVEAQGIFGQFGIQTALGGLTSAADGANFLDTRTVATGLNGLTSALIRTDSIPFVINALASNAETRIVARPQVLIDDNEEASIASIEQQPTTSQSQSTSTTTTSFSGFQDAGPQLTVTPHISEGGYVRLEYDITLSSFRGQATETGIPPPRQQNTINSKSVRVPTDSTIVVGGLSFETTRDTVVKVPLLGDIPLVGLAFRNTQKSLNTTTLYVFITPRIMRDDHFLGERLNSIGPAEAAGVDTGPPLPEPVPMEVTGKEGLTESIKELFPPAQGSGQ